MACTRGCQSFASLIRSITTDDIKPTTYIDRMLADTTLNPVLRLSSAVSVSNSRRGTRTSSIQEARIAIPTISVAIVEGPSILKALVRNSLLLRMKSPRWKSRDTPVARDQIDAATMGSVSQRPTFLPIHTASAVMIAALTNSPLNKIDMGGSSRVLPKRRIARLTSGDLATAMANNTAPHRIVASCRAFRSCHSSMHPS